MKEKCEFYIETELLKQCLKMRRMNIFKAKNVHFALEETCKCCNLLPLSRFWHVKCHHFLGWKVMHNLSLSYVGKWIQKLAHFSTLVLCLSTKSSSFPSFAFTRENTICEMEVCFPTWVWWWQRRRRHCGKAVISIEEIFKYHVVQKDAALTFSNGIWDFLGHSVV